MIVDISPAAPRVALAGAVCCVLTDVRAEQANMVLTWEPIDTIALSQPLA